MRRAPQTVLAGLYLFAASQAHADWAEIQARKTLRVLAVVVEGEPEFFSLDKDKAGFDHELLLTFASRHKLKLEVVRCSGWDQLIPELEAGHGDLIAGRFTETEARRQRIAFTVPVFPTRNVVVTREPTPPVKSLAALKTLRIGLVKGTSMVEALTAAGVPASAIDTSVPSGGAFAALEAGKFGATVEDVAGAILAQRADSKLQLGIFVGPPGNYAYGVRRADDALLRELNSYVDLLRRTPSWNRLVVKYFGDSALEILKKARE